MNKSRTIAAKLSGNRCLERGCVVLNQPQRVAKVWLSGIIHALRLVFDTAALLSVTTMYWFSVKRRVAEKA